MLIISRSGAAYKFILQNKIYNTCHTVVQKKRMLNMKFEKKHPKTKRCFYNKSTSLSNLRALKKMSQYLKKKFPFNEKS